MPCQFVSTTDNYAGICCQPHYRRLQVSYLAGSRGRGKGVYTYLIQTCMRKLNPCQVLMKAL